MRVPLIAVCGIFAIAGIQAASAADMGPPPVYKAPPPPVFSWTGFYLGGNFGGDSYTQSFSGTQTTPFGSTAFSGSAGSDGNTGLLGGGQIGFNYEFPARIVIGVEADGDWSNLFGSAAACSTFTSGLFAGSTAGCASNSMTLKDFGTVRGRLGYALPWGPVMLYGTGGWAWGSVSGNSTLTCLGPGCGATTLPFTGGTASFSNSLSGWTAGAGIEWAFVPNWTLKMEYLHLEFDGVSTTYSTTVNGLPTTTHISSNNGVQVWRIGINYLFNFGGPPLVAAY